MLFLEQALDLSAAVKADASHLHPRLERVLALVTASRNPNVAGESLAHVAAEVEVLEQEGVGVSKVIAVADFSWFGFSAHDDFEIHDSACLGLLHLDRP